MNITINTKSSKPIYEQIEEQIKDEIVAGSLKAGEMLPSIRSLAGDLKISVITTKRAYADLEAEGMIKSTPGKGFFVDNPDLVYLSEKKTVGLEEKLTEWVDIARKAGVTKAEAVDMLEILWDSEA
ncbi:MAG: GntR family transcriptional regulator [Lachnospiraceae bacterium]|nr:GntR family transcriptional regulator [Lachnospiraceae bacterium]